MWKLAGQWGHEEAITDSIVERKYMAELGLNVQASEAARLLLEGFEHI
jgi:hypothetical protein